MPLEVTTGDLFASGAQTLVNTVNAVGMMGKGVALEFKRRFPDMHADYVVRCQRHEVRLGQPYLYRRPDPPWIVNFPTKKHWRDVSAWVALAEIVERIQSERYHWPVGRTRFQKIAYFATVRGIPTGLQFSRGSYGPFAPGLKQVTAKLINNGVLREDHGPQMIRVLPGKTLDDARAEYRKRLQEWQPIVRDVTDLFQRLDTRSTEVAASALLVAQEFESQNKPYSERDIVDEVLRWKVRRTPPIDEPQLAQATRDINLLGWIKAAVSDDLPLIDDE